MQIGGTGAEVFRRLGDIILRRCGGKRLTGTGREEREGERERAALQAAQSNRNRCEGAKGR